MKIKVWRSDQNKWIVKSPGFEDGMFTICRTWELAMAQVRWLLQHLRSA